MAPTSTACAVLDGSACTSDALVPPSSTPTGSSGVAVWEQTVDSKVTDEGGLSPAQIGGIFLGSFFGFMLVVLLVLLCLRRRGYQQSTSRSTSPTHSPPRASPYPQRKSKPKQSPFSSYNRRENEVRDRVETLQRKEPGATIVIKVPGFGGIERRPRVFEIPEDEDDDDEEEMPPPPSPPVQLPRAR